MMKRALVWLRRDLRLDDHAALNAAETEAQSIALAFVFDRTILNHLQDADDRRITFILESLREVDRQLRVRGSQLLVRAGDPIVEIPRLATALGVQTVYANCDYEPYAVARDNTVATALQTTGCNLQLYRDHVIFEPHEIRNQQGRPYRVYTQYKNSWLRAEPDKRLHTYPVILHNLMPSSHLTKQTLDLDHTTAGFAPATDLVVQPGSQAAQRRLADFISQDISAYRESRDLPALERTSGLSVHLRFGTISTRACFRAIQTVDQGLSGAEIFRNELVWREFFQMILGEFPYVAGSAFQRHYDRIVWPGPDAHFEAWCAGQTGYPLVDAAMRCLRATGTMHNRLRMVVASFLVKDLQVDWRRGEAWFARWLLDFDLAANNGGWQWCASTGCDAQPYFRIFNPVSQSERYDPQGTYIRRWLPELSALPDAHIHWPWEHLAARKHARSAGYPEPLVDHAQQRLLTLSLYKNVR